MALNLTPEYFEADRKYRQASTPQEELAALEEMLRAIPKHKASEKKQSDLKRRISELKQSATQKKKSSTTTDPYHIVPQGAGQALLLGLPNSGKSSIVAALTKASVKVTDYPFGSPLPVPGMASYEDVPIELVDLPPVTPEHVPGNLINAVRHTNALLLVVDLSADSVLEDIDTLLGILADHGMEYEVEPDDDGTEETTDEEARAMRVGPDALIICTKADLPGSDDNLETLKELRSDQPPMLAVSAETGEGLDDMLGRLFEMLGVIRIYSKQPGKPVDREKPFILPSGSTIEELARTIHKDLAEQLKHARIWGEHVHDGQQVHGTHVLYDKDVVELHT
jgi:hypothetical protein